MSFYSRVRGSYIEIPQIHALATANEVTVAVCIRGHSQRGPLAERYHRANPKWSTHFWIYREGSLFARTSYRNIAGTPAQTDISTYRSWVHVAFTVSDDRVESTTTKLYVNGVRRDIERGPEVTLILASNIRLGYNPDGGDTRR